MFIAILNLESNKLYKDVIIMKLKRTYLLYLFLMLNFTLSNIFAQRFEVTPYVGYQFTGSLTTTEGKLSMKDGMNYGMILDITVQKDMQAEFWYSRTESDLSYKLNDATSYTFVDDMSIEYFHAGALYVPEWGRIRPIGIFTLGFTRSHLKSGNYDDDWRFSIGVGGGAKFFLTKNIAFRVQGRLLIPIFTSNATVYCTNGGCLFHIEAGEIIFQPDFNAGLTIAF